MMIPFEMNKLLEYEIEQSLQIYILPYGKKHIHVIMNNSFKKNNQ